MSLGNIIFYKILIFFTMSPQHYYIMILSYAWTINTHKQTHTHVITQQNLKSVSIYKQVVLINFS